mgnify:FL=1
MDNSSDEMKIIIPKGCDNAPRKQIIIDFTVAILKQQNEVVEKYADESIVWFQLKENKKIESLSALLTILQNENKDIIETLEVYQVITHGKFASINGVISLANGTKVDFCDVYTFSNTAKSGKVKEIKSYKVA